MCHPTVGIDAMANQSQTPTDGPRAKINSTEIDEGDRVFMGINLHGTSDGQPGVEYDGDLYQAGVEGTVIEALSESEKSFLADGRRPLADLTVETDDGDVYTWNVDNGYVIGPCDDPDRPDRSDVGKIGGFYTA
jgi:hypothetical protein